MDAAALAALWATVAGPVGQLARLPPPAPPEAVFSEAAAGRVGRMSLPGKGVGAWGLLPVPRELAWLAMTDDRLADDVESLTEVRLRGAWTQPKLIYQRLDLPWPFADRHWVLDVANTTVLAQQTGVWERAWTQDGDALAAVREKTDVALFDAAETLPHNRGNWLLVPVDSGHTLAIYQVWTDLGGSIPPAAVEAWVRASLSDLYADLTVHAAAVRARYGPGCDAQIGPDGKTIACHG